MTTLELLKEAIRLAKQLGYGVREELLGGQGGGMCELKGRKWLFLDVALGPEEQLEIVLSALRSEPDAVYMPMHDEIRRMLSS